MPDQLKSSEVNSQTDPSVAKQYDSETPAEKQIQDFFNFVDGKKIGILSTYRNGIGTPLFLILDNHPHFLQFTDTSH
jgi:hypothetical protein